MGDLSILFAFFSAFHALCNADLRMKKTILGDDMNEEQLDEHVAKVLEKQGGKALSFPSFDVESVRIVVGHNPADGTRLVYEPEGYKESVLGSIGGRFKYAVKFFNAQEVEPYTKEEFDKSCAGYEDNPDNRQIVTLDEYKKAFEGIEAAMYGSFGSSARKTAIDMKNIMKDVDKQFDEYKQSITAQKDALDHQKYLLETFSFEEALQPDQGMSLEDEDGFYLDQYDPKTVAILLTGDDRGGIVCTGEDDNPIVYCTHEQLEEMKGSLVTINQFAGDHIAHSSLDSGAGLEALMRIKGIESGLEVYKQGLDQQQNDLNSKMGALSVTEPVSAELSFAAVPGVVK